MYDSRLLDVFNDPTKGFTRDIRIDESTVSYIRFVLFWSGESSYISAVRGQTQRKVDGTFMDRLPHVGRWLNASLLTCDSPMGIFDLVIGPKTAPTTDSSWIETRDSSHRIENLETSDSSHRIENLDLFFFNNYFLVNRFIITIFMISMRYGDVSTSEEGGVMGQPTALPFSAPCPSSYDNLFGCWLS